MTAPTPVPPPPHPYRVLLTAILLPGFGHVVGGFPQRGLILQAFMILMAWITWHATPPERDLIGRLSGGIFIYAVSIMDAYRLSQLRYAAYRRSVGMPAVPSGILVPSKRRRLS
jgi:hypothetical protein